MTKHQAQGDAILQRAPNIEQSQTTCRAHSREPRVQAHAHVRVGGGGVLSPGEHDRTVRALGDLVCALDLALHRACGREPGHDALGNEAPQHVEGRLGVPLDDEVGARLELGAQARRVAFEAIEPGEQSAARHALQREPRVVRLAAEILGGYERECGDAPLRRGRRHCPLTALAGRGGDELRGAEVDELA